MSDGRKTKRIIRKSNRDLLTLALSTVMGQLLSERQQSLEDRDTERPDAGARNLRRRFSQSILPLLTIALIAPQKPPQERGAKSCSRTIVTTAETLSCKRGRAKEPAHECCLQNLGIEYFNYVSNAAGPSGSSQRRPDPWTRDS